MVKVIETKAALKAAIADRTEEIVIAPKLEETIGWIVDAVRLPWEKRVALLCFLGVGLVALLFAPTPEYTEGFWATLLSIWAIMFKTIIVSVVVIAVTCVFSMISRINAMLILFLLIQGIFFGPVATVRMICRYDVVDAGVKMAPGQNNRQNGYGIRIRYRKK